MRVLFRSSFDRWTGYGNDAVDIALTLDGLGVDVVPFADGLHPGMPRQLLRLFEKSPFLREFDAVLQFAVPQMIRPDALLPYSDRVFGWSMWERTPLLESDWDEVPGLWSVDKWRGLTSMFVTCPMNVEAFQAVDKTTPIVVAPCGVAEWPDQARDRGRPMRFLMVGMLGGRKDPFLLLDVWRELKAEVFGFDATLTLKTSAPGLHPGIEDVYPGVRVLTGVRPREEMAALYGAHDVLVSVSRGEGNDKPAMEFMATGGAVLASDWGGHQNWLHEDWAYPLPGRVIGSGFGWSDFRVDRDVLKERLLECWRNPEQVREKGRRARGVMMSRFSWEVCVERVVQGMSLI